MTGSVAGLRSLRRLSHFMRFRVRSNFRCRSRRAEPAIARKVVWRPCTGAAEGQ